jgi:hypothetical protein
MWHLLLLLKEFVLSMADLVLAIFVVMFVFWLLLPGNVEKKHKRFNKELGRDEWY